MLGFASAIQFLPLTFGLYSLLSVYYRLEERTASYSHFLHFLWGFVVGLIRFQNTPQCMHWQGCRNVIIIARFRSGEGRTNKLIRDEI